MKKPHRNRNSCVMRLKEINLIARVAVAFIFIYHGLVPKILWLSPIEVALVNAHDLDATIISPVAGVGEVILGASIVLLRRTLVPIYLAVCLLFVLLLDVLFFMPHLLIEAFNPVTINVATIVICYFIYVTQEYTFKRCE